MSVLNWSGTAADNDDADLSNGIDWREGQLPATVNNSSRSMMAALYKYVRDTSGDLTSTGSANAYVLTTAQTITAYAEPLILAFKANFSCTGAATINVDGLGAKDILRRDGTATQSGDIVSTGCYVIAYSDALTKFIGINISGAGAGSGDALTSNPLSQFAATTSAQLAGVMSDETGTGALVFANTPTLVTPVLGTPTSGTLTNCTGLPVAGITASTVTALGVGSLELGHATDTTLSRASAGVLAVEGVNVLLNGGALGTPSSGTLTNCTGLPVAGITASTSTSLGVGSVELGHATDTTLSRSSAGVLAVEGVTVPLNSTTNTHTAQQIELGHASDTTLTRASAGVLAVEGVNVLLNGGALGTPSSGTLTNCTGLPVAGITSSTSTALGVGSLELGHASDTTLARSAAGTVTIEGSQILTAKGQTLAALFPGGSVPPSTNYATYNVRNGHPVLEFDTTTGESTTWTGIMPRRYSGNGITVYVHSMMASATSGTVGWTVEIERMDAGGTDFDSDSFASAQTITAATVPGTSGQILVQNVAITSGVNMDSLVAGEPYRIRITRDVANDTATGDAQLVMVEIRETP